MELVRLHGVRQCECGWQRRKSPVSVSIFHSEQSGNVQRDKTWSHPLNPNKSNFSTITLSKSVQERNCWEFKKNKKQNSSLNQQYWFSFYVLVGKKKSENPYKLRPDRIFLSFVCFYRLANVILFSLKYHLIRVNSIILKGTHAKLLGTHGSRKPFLSSKYKYKSLDPSRHFWNLDRNWVMWSNETKKEVFCQRS